MTLLKKIWEGWKKVGQAIGDFLARVILTVFYFTIFLPFALGVMLFSDPLLKKKPSSPSFWLDRSTLDKVLADMRNQF